ncbi:hypothetical protein [Labedaea rhizosphaerae]|uniref:Uncharacterized protein n=1 Tax=Labedaea rhizosphaerae TaxID=598644 RepID=A0A4R6SPF6_LABRH|nr:hypothetical protein [Labedaea rhizosphaerae]TDQ05904.1 hypothetical protein EV186_1011882 [Labedaea rhizosphaerae]
MPNADPAEFLAYRVAVYARLHAYETAATTDNDAYAAQLARTELPRHLRHWLPRLQAHEPDKHGNCPTCSHWWRKVAAPCDLWRWFHGFLTVEPAHFDVPSIT